MMRPFFVLILLLPFSGCLTPSPAPPVSIEQDSWGLGLAVPAKWPEPGLYTESRRDVEQLEAFIRTAGATAGAACDPKTPARMNESFAKGYILAALGRMLFACGNHNPTSSSTNQTVTAASLNQTKAALEAAMPPATIVEAELLAYLMREFQTLLDTFRAGDFQTVQGESDAIRAFLTTYPWKDGSCTYPQLPEFIEETRQIMTRSLKVPSGLPSEGPLARKAGYADEQRQVILESQPYLDYAIQNGWWPSIVRGRETLDWRAAIIENTTRTSWPTMIEARLIIDQYRNATRTLTTDTTIESIEWIFENWGPGWERDPWPAMRIYPIQGMEWHFGAAECSSPATGSA
jgi:hypothetical protein